MFFQRAKTLLLFLCISTVASAQSYISYDVSFTNAVQHEAQIKASFTKITPGNFSVRMSRSSPGRYAVHEFSKNVYDVKATDSKGKELKITRPNPYQWDIADQDGTVNISYTLFGNKGDGTYAQIDETHAHLNIPATFIYAPSMAEKPIQVTINPRADLNWKIATQLKKVFDNTYYAPNLQYFMDSPIEVSNFQKRSFEVSSNGDKYTINFVLHHDGTEAELDEYFEQVKKIVLQQEAVYGEFPKYDFGEYTFLACYLPNVSGDGMEHRNSTVIPSTRSLANGGMKGNIGTVSHEYFHSWNVERIRPTTLEPFDFSRANMSGELWFAEGFTQYYTALFLCRAGIISPSQYINGLGGTFNYVWNSPARNHFNPIEMSYQAPFVDAATSIDPVNRENTFISYYSYGSVLGLALDLSLRNEKGNKSLDDFMKLVWETYGKNEKSYTEADLNATLNKYAGKLFGNYFFDNYIYQSAMPNYEALFKSVGIVLKQERTTPYMGISVSRDGIASSNPFEGSPAYKAGLNKGDKILSINQEAVNGNNTFQNILNSLKPGDRVKINYSRYNVLKTVQITLAASPEYSITTYEKAGLETTETMLKKREEWLGKK